MSIERVEWKEIRSFGSGTCEPFFIIAQKICGVWKFFERSSWELRWLEIPSTPEIKARLITEIAKAENAKTSNLIDGRPSYTHSPPILARPKRE